MITHESSLENFTEQFDYVLENYKEHGYDIHDFDNIVLGGLGGSGIGALIAKNWFFDKCNLPIETVADYKLPSYVSRKTLVVLNSYSGNTEETLSMFEQAKEEGCKTLIITGGGKLKQLAEENNLPTFPLKGGYQPRMTIGFGLSYLLLILGELNGQDLRDEIKSVRNKFKKNKGLQQESANRIFDYFKNTIKNKFVIVSDRQFTPIAVRFQQQVNENAKLEAFVNVLPEANHNVIESYTDKLPTNFLLLYSTANHRVEARFDFLTSHLELDNNKVLPLQIPTFDIYAMYDVIHRLDWVSVHLANELDAPLMEVPIITNLKEFLSSIEIIDEEE